MADDDAPDGTHGHGSAHDPLDPQIRAAAHALIEHYAGSAGQATPVGPSGSADRAGTSSMDASTCDISSVAASRTPRPGRRFVAVALVGLAIAAAIALVVVLASGTDGNHEVVTAEPMQDQPASGPTLLVPLGTDSSGTKEGTTALLFDAETLEMLGEIRLPSSFSLGLLGGTSLEQVSLVDGRLEFLYGTYSDVTSIVPRGTVDEATDLEAALWSEDRLTTDRLAYIMRLGPRGTLLSADRGLPTGATDPAPGALPDGNIVMDERWTVTTGDGDDTQAFTWDDGPLPGEGTQVFTPDESAIVDLHASSVDDMASIDVSTLALDDDCSVCSANPRSFEVADVHPGFVIHEAGFLDDSTMWVYWDSPPNEQVQDPLAREVGLATVDLVSGRTAVLPDPVPGIDYINAMKPLASSGDGTMFVQQLDDHFWNTGVLWRWDGVAWTQVQLPPAPEGLRYQGAFVLPDRPDSLDAARDDRGGWCVKHLEGAVPDLPKLGQVVLDVSGSEQRASQIEGLTEVVEALIPHYWAPPSHVWARDCTIAVQLSGFAWDRLLMRFAVTDDGRFALVATDRWSRGRP